MFKRILIPIDGSRPSQNAARLALGFAKSIGTQAIVMHVVYRQVLHGLESDALERLPYTKYGEQLLEPWNETGKKLGVTLETRLQDGEGLGVAETIIRVATSERCNLIVMGTQGREGLERMLLGSVAERVVRLSNVPVMLVRPSVVSAASAGFGFERILVPVDGSTASGKALWVANEIAVRMNAELEFLYVIPDMPAPMVDPIGMNPLVYNSEEWAKLLEQEAREVIAEAKAATTAQNVRAQSVLASGRRTAQVITQTAQARHTSLIVMGTHGRGGFDRLLLGSVAEGVAHHADVPVLLVRAPDALKT